MSNSPLQVINLNAFQQAITDAYANHVLTKVNDHVVRLGVMTEDYYWHYHPNSDETFIVVDGMLLLDIGDTTFELKPGDLFTVPSNTPHRTRPKGARSANITIESADMQTVRIT